MFNHCLKQYTFSKNSNENAGHLGIPGFSGFFYFAVCGGVFCAFPYDRGLFSVIFLHFAQKYRCVPKIGFPADIFFIFLHFLKRYRYVSKIGFSADISIDNLIDISIDILIGISIDILIDFLIGICIDISIDILIDIIIGIFMDISIVIFTDIFH